MSALRNLCQPSAVAIILCQSLVLMQLHIISNSHATGLVHLPRPEALADARQLSGFLSA